MSVSVSDSLCFNGAILSLITLAAASCRWWCWVAGGGCSASRRREGLKRKKEERVVGKGSGGWGRSRGAAFSVSACPTLSAGCA